MNAPVKVLFEFLQRMVSNLKGIAAAGRYPVLTGDPEKRFHLGQPGMFTAVNIGQLFQPLADQRKVLVHIPVVPFDDIVAQFGRGEAVQVAGVPVPHLQDRFDLGDEIRNADIQFGTCHGEGFFPSAAEVDRQVFKQFGGPVIGADNISDGCFRVDVHGLKIYGSDTWPWLCCSTNIENPAIKDKKILKYEIKIHIPGGLLLIFRQTVGNFFIYFQYTIHRKPMR